MILLDTHAAVRFAINEGLGRKSQRIADKALADDRLAVSAISFWEIAMLIGKRRLRALKSTGELRAKLLMAGMRELTGEIAILAAELEGPGRDPADRMIAATAIAHDAALMTADETLLRWRHRLQRHDAGE